jgi:single-strand DNA-binding protein
MTEREIPAWADINEVTLRGRLGKDAESHTFQNGGMAVKFSLATSEKWTDRRTGDRVEKTEWHNLVIKFNDAAINTALDLKKGTRVKIIGKITSRSWDAQDGTRKSITEIEVGRFGKIEIVPDDREPAAKPARQASSGGGYPPRHGESMMDDEIPFAPCWE